MNAMSAMAIAAALASATAAAADGEAGRARRVTLALDDEARAELLAEMRLHLSNLQVFLDAVSRHDLRAAATAARGSGIAAASEANDQISRRLPKDFTALGMSMHADFDGLADAAARGEDPQVLVGKLAVTLQKCVACHASYQLPPRAAHATAR